MASNTDYGCILTVSVCCRYQNQNRHELILSSNIQKNDLKHTVVSEGILYVRPQRHSKGCVNQQCHSLVQR